jgi:hypothetical protein
MALEEKRALIAGGSRGIEGGLRWHWQTAASEKLAGLHDRLFTRVVAHP